MWSGPHTNFFFRSSFAMDVSTAAALLLFRFQQKAKSIKEFRHLILYYLIFFFTKKRDAIVISMWMSNKKKVLADDFFSPCYHFFFLFKLNSVAKTMVNDKWWDLQQEPLVGGVIKYDYFFLNIHIDCVKISIIYQLIIDGADLPTCNINFNLFNIYFHQINMF